MVSTLQFTGFTLPPRRRPADFLEDRVVRLEDGGQEVRGGVRVVDGPGKEPILLEQVEMVADRAVVKAEGLAELVRVVRSRPESLDDPGAVLPASGARDQVPEELPHRAANRGGNP